MPLSHRPVPSGPSFVRTLEVVSQPSTGPRKWTRFLFPRLFIDKIYTVGIFERSFHFPKEVHVNYDTILVLNSGSSSLKYALYESGALRLSGTFDRIGFETAGWIARDSELPNEVACSEIELGNSRAVRHADCISRLLGHLGLKGITVTAVGHRVVHGGTHFREPVVISEESYRQMSELSKLAPLHQPHNLAGIDAMRVAMPNALQVACFDTAFHADRPLLSRMYAIPRRYFDEGVMAYGFHGLSYEYVASQIPTVMEHSDFDRVVVCHLGNGSSLCAIKNGKSVSSSMGFTALEGLPMGTRCGNIDAGVVLHLLEQEQGDIKRVTNILYKESGLLGVSGVSSDVRDLEKAEAGGNGRATDAIELFADRIAEGIVRMAQAMRGIDAIVFTAGIGEHSARVRKAVCDRLDWLRLRLDPEENAKNSTRISYPSSYVSVWVIPTQEEYQIARSVEKLLSVGDMAA